MYSIGEISKIVRISSDTLRYYDQIGLLKPHRVNGSNRYRLYSKEQVQDILFILEMKEYGFSLDEIRGLLPDREGLQTEAALRNRCRELNQEQERIGRTIRHLERKLDQFNKKGGNDTMKRPNILIVDDSAFMRSMVKDIVTRAGFSVVGEAAGGEEGLGLFERLRPELVILDIHMPPGMDGIETARRIRAADGQAAIVMLSARSHAGYITGAWLAGADAFVVKPFQPDMLLDSLADRPGRTDGGRAAGPGRIPGWMTDRHWADKLPDGPLPQETVNRLLALCAGEESGEKLPDLLL